jgi:alanyl-tRNA synthetase
MIERIYYTDPGCRSFEATVTRSETRDGRALVTLDRTAFYPTSGGQPFDTGTLGGATVLDVLDIDEEVVHVVSEPLTVGARVHGEIGWERRFDHMQQHTGQHLLSAEFDRLFEAVTVGFHMGAETATVDLSREVTSAEIAQSEDEANRIVWEDRPVAIRFVSAAEAASLPLRKEPAREGALRLIEVDGFDLSACGGTHVARTGSVGIIAVLASERFKGGSRVTFACGGRALHALRGLRDVVAGSVRVLSVLPEELPNGIRKLQADAKDLRKTLETTRGALARYEGEALLAGATVLRGVRIVVRVVADKDVAMLKTMALSAVAGGTAIVALLTPDSPAQVVIARSPDAPCDARAILKALTTQFGGRGGGTPELVQGGGLTGDVRAIEWALSGLVEEL